MAENNQLVQILAQMIEALGSINDRLSVIEQLLTQQPKTRTRKKEPATQAKPATQASQVTPFDTMDVTTLTLAVINMAKELSHACDVNSIDEQLEHVVAHEKFTQGFFIDGIAFSIDKMSGVSKYLKQESPKTWDKLVSLVNHLSDQEADFLLIVVTSALYAVIHEIKAPVF